MLLIPTLPFVYTNSTPFFLLACLTLKKKEDTEKEMY